MIQVRLAALSGSDSASDPDRAVWRFRHGGGDVLALPEGGFSVEGFCAAFGIGWRVRDMSPLKWELHGNFRLPCANLLKAEQLEENPADPVAAGAT